MTRKINVKLPVEDDSNEFRGQSKDTNFETGDSKDTNLDISDKDNDSKITIEEKEYKLDSQGNALNEDGSVFKTKVELNSEKNKDDKKDKDSKNDKDSKEDEDDVELILVDNKEYKLDKYGNALKDDGSIFMSKEELDKLEKVDVKSEDESNEGSTLNVEDIEKYSGIELFDKEGNKIIYENTVEGIAKREADIKEHFLNEGKTSSINEFMENNPDIYRMVSYKDKHGTLEGYKEGIDYSKVVLDKTNEQQLSDIIIEAQLKKGDSIDRAKKILGYIKADGKLFEEAEESQQFLIDIDQKEKITERNEQQKKINDQIKQVENYYGFTYNEKGEEVPLNIEGSVYDTIINKGQVDDLVIPTDGIKVKSDGKVKNHSRKDILRYISTVVDNGFSQAQIDEQKRLSNSNKRLKQYIYNLTGGDISSLVNVAKKRDRVKDIKARLTTKQSSSHTSNASTTKQVKLPIR